MKLNRQQIQFLLTCVDVLVWDHPSSVLSYDQRKEALSNLENILSEAKQHLIDCPDVEALYFTYDSL